MTTLDAKYMIAPSLQEYFVDKVTGMPLAGGKITFYSDINRTEKKKVYKLSGTSPNYTYDELPNPSTLGSTGTFVDELGNDILPFYYPYDDNGNVELYFIDVKSATEVDQFTREAFPPNAGASSASSSNFTNFIPNGQFLLHSNLPAYTGINNPHYLAGEIRAANTDIAAGNWSFNRPNSSNATDLVTFNLFGSYVSTPTASPKYYIRAKCTSPHEGDTFKDLRINFPDVNKFASQTQEYTFSMEAKSNTGSAFDVELILIKNYGTGGSTTTETVIETFTLGASYQTQTKSFIFGINTGKAISPVGDDVVSLAIRFPSSSVFDFSASNFLLTVNNVIINTFPTTTNAEFTSDSLVAIPPPDPDGFDMYCPLVQTKKGLQFSRADIGKVYPAVYSLPNVGELKCAGGTFEAEAYSSDFIPYARLQSQIYFPSYVNCPLYGTGLNYVTAVKVYGNSAQIMIVTNSPGLVGVSVDGTIPTNFGITNLNAGNYYLFTAYAGGTYNADGTFVLVVSDEYSSGFGYPAPSNGTTGFTFRTYATNSSLPLAYQTFYFFPGIVVIADLAGKYLTFTAASSGFHSQIDYYLWFKVDGVGSDPAPGGTGILLNISSTFTYNDLVNAMAYAISGYQITLLSTVTAASSVTPGSYFKFDTIDLLYYVWFQVDGAGDDPELSNRSSILVSLSSLDTADQVAQKIITKINSKFFAVPDLRGCIIKGAHGKDNAQDNTFRYSLYKDGDPEGSGPATFQLDGTALHTHTATTDVGISPAPGTVLIGHVGGGVGNTTSGSNLGDAAALNVSASTTVARAGAQRSNPYNVAMNYFIKY